MDETIIYFTGGEVTISVTEINSDFWGNNNISVNLVTKIQIGTSVTIIGNNAFPQNADSLTDVVFESGSQVASIGSNAFKNTGLTTITIPASVTSIGANAFNGCSSLRSVIFKSGSILASIGQNAFQSTGLTTITIPASVTSIGANAFSGCTGLTSISIPSSVTSIGDDAFENCTSLISISIPNKVTSIGASAFKGCTNLLLLFVNNGSNITLGSSAFEDSGLLHIYFNPDDNDAGNETITINGVTIRNYNRNQHNFGGKIIEIISKPAAIANYTPLKTYYIDTSEDEDVYEITHQDPTQFQRSDFGDITNDTVKEVFIGIQIQMIKAKTFQDRENLEKVHMLNRITSIQFNAFHFCKTLEFIILPTYLQYFPHKNRITDLGTVGPDNGSFKIFASINSNFYNKPYTFNRYNNNVLIERNVLSLRPIVKDTNNNTVEINTESSTIIKYSDFINTFESYGLEIGNIKTINLGYFATTFEDETAIDGQLWENLTSVDFGNVEKLGKNLFTTYTRNINSNGLFKNCYQIEKLTIPSSVTQIGDKFFTFDLEFTSDPDLSGSIEKLKIDFISSTTLQYIGDYAFYNCVKLYQGDPFPDLPDSILAIGNFAFSKCRFNQINIPSGLATNDNNNNNEITKTYWFDDENRNSGYDVNTHGDKQEAAKTAATNCIGISTFEGCGFLESVGTLPDITRISKNAFYGCSNLDPITIPTSVEYIEVGAFSGCGGIRQPYDVNFNQDSEIKTITSGSFKNTIVNIPNSVEYIQSGDIHYNNIISIGRAGNSSRLIFEAGETTNGGVGIIEGGEITNEWTHLVATLTKDGVMKLYQDGELLQTLSPGVFASDNRFGNEDNLRIDGERIINESGETTRYRYGRHFIGKSARIGGHDYFKGNMKYLRIWKNYELTQSDVSNLYNNRETNDYYSNKSLGQNPTHAWDLTQDEKFQYSYSGNVSKYTRDKLNESGRNDTYNILQKNYILGYENNESGPEVISNNDNDSAPEIISNNDGMLFSQLYNSYIMNDAEFYTGAGGGWPNSVIDLRDTCSFEFYVKFNNTIGTFTSYNTINVSGVDYTLKDDGGDGITTSFQDVYVTSIVGNTFTCSHSIEGILDVGQSVIVNAPQQQLDRYFDYTFTISSISNNIFFTADLNFIPDVYVAKYRLKNSNGTAVRKQYETVRITDININSGTEKTTFTCNQNIADLLNIDDTVKITDGDDDNTIIITEISGNTFTIDSTEITINTINNDTFTVDYTLKDENDNEVITEDTIKVTSIVGNTFTCSHSIEGILDVGQSVKINDGSPVTINTINTDTFIVDYTLKDENGDDILDVNDEAIKVTDSLGSTFTCNLSIDGILNVGDSVIINNGVTDHIIIIDTIPNTTNNNKIFDYLENYTTSTGVVKPKQLPSSLEIIESGTMSFNLKNNTIINNEAIPSNLKFINDKFLYENESISSENLIIPNSVVGIGYSNFQHMVNHFSREIDGGGFRRYPIDNYRSLGYVYTNQLSEGNLFGAFKNSNLSKITIGYGVKYIGAHTFSKCRNLTSVTFEKKKTSYIATNIKGTLDTEGNLTIRNNSNKKYNNFIDFNDYIFDYTQNIALIGYGAYKWGIAYQGYEDPYVSETLSRIEWTWMNYNDDSWSYYHTSGVLTRDTIKSDVIDFFPDDGDLDGGRKYTLFEKKTFPSQDNPTIDTIFSVEETVNHAVIYDTDLHLYIPHFTSIKFIGEKAFNECTELTTITIPASVNFIDYAAFSGCTNLTTVTFETDSELKILGREVFLGCTSLESFTIPDGVNILQSRLFLGCTNLQSITIPASVYNIDVESQVNLRPMRGYYYDSTWSYYRNMWNNRKNKFIFGDCENLESVTLKDPQYIFTSSEAGGTTTFTCTTNLSSVISSNDSIRLETRPPVITYDSEWSESDNVTLYYDFTPDNLDFTDGTSFNTTAPSTHSFKRTLNQLVIIDGKLKLIPVLESIPRHLFFDLPKLKKIVLPNSITTIEDNAFNGCTALTTITIPDSVTSILMHAFYYSGLEVIILEESSQLETIQEYAFAFTGLQSIFIPSGVTILDKGLFQGCSTLTSITIPNEVTSIGENLFDGCTKLASITIPNGVTSIGASAFKDCSSLTSITISNSVTSIGNNAFQGCIALESIIIPINVTSLNVSSVFNGCTNLQEIVTTNENQSYLNEHNSYDIGTSTNVTIVFTGSKFTRNNGAYYSTIEIDGTIYSDTYNNKFFTTKENLTNVELQTTVTEISDNTFDGCTVLETITMEEGLTTIGEKAFNKCESLQSITIPSTLTSIGNKAFNECSQIKILTIKSSEILEETAFMDEFFEDTTDSLETITISPTIIGEEAFESCTALTTIIFDTESFTEIKNKAFKGCVELTSITIPSTVTTIGQSVFDGCAKLATVTFEDGSQLQTINAIAFRNCEALTSITIPSNVTSINNFLFNGCIKLKTVSFNGNITNIARSAFEGCVAFENFTIPNTVTNIDVNAFKNCYGLTSITIPDSVLTIKDDVFNGCTNLKSISIGNSITSIGENAFLNSALEIVYINEGNNVDYIEGEKEIDGIVVNIIYSDINIKKTNNVDVTINVAGEFNASSYSSNVTNTDIKEVVLKSSINSIGDGAFSGCTGLTTITIPTTVTSIGANAFKDCSSLTSISIPNTVTSIGDGVFNGCTGLTTITIENTVTSIGANAFSGCTGLTTITIPTTVTSIGANAFDGCTGLTTITIPTSVTSIGANAFSGCTGLTTITIPTSVTSIGASAFNGCTGLTFIAIPNSVTTIGANTFNGCTNLTIISIGNSVETIGENAFLNSGLEKLYIDSDNGLDYTESTEVIGGQSDVEIIFFDIIIVTDTDSGIIFNIIGEFSDSSYSGIDNTDIKKVELKRSITSIADDTFNGCENMTSITIPTSVTSIGVNAFKDCSSLISISIPSSVTSIGADAFNGCTEVTSIIIPTGVSNIPENAFQGCTKLESVTFASISQVTTIDANAFNGCSNLTYIVIPDSVTSIGENAFLDSSLAILKVSNNTQLKINDVIISTGSQTIGGKKEVNVTIPGVIFINSAGVEFTEDISYTITSESYNSITPSELRTVIISDKTPTIGIDAFIGSGLTQLIILSTHPYITTNSLKTGINTIGGKEGVNLVFSDTTYEGDTNTSSNNIIGEVQPDDIPNTVTSVALGNNVTSIGTDAFKGYTSLESIIIPTSVTTIGANAFSGCTSLQSIIIPTSVTSIGASAFNGCRSLQSIIIPSSITTIEDNTFNGCSSLTSIIIPDSVSSIGSYVFTDTYALEWILIPRATSITGTTFNNAGKSDGFRILTDSDDTKDDNLNQGVYSSNNSITGQNNVKVIHVNSVITKTDNQSVIVRSIRNPDNGIVDFNDDNTVSIALYKVDYTSLNLNPTDIKNVVFNSNIVEIKANVFNGATNLEEITIPNSISSIGVDAFKSCANIRTLTLDCNDLLENTPGFISYYFIDSKDILQTLIIGDNVTMIPDKAFEKSVNLQTVTFHPFETSQLVTIGSKAFDRCSNLRGITLPSFTYVIGQEAFCNCSLLETFDISICNNLQSIEKKLLYNCPLIKRLVFPTNIQIIADDAFKLTGIEFISTNNPNRFPYGANKSHGGRIGIFIVPIDFFESGQTIIEYYLVDGVRDSNKSIKLVNYGDKVNTDLISTVADLESEDNVTIDIVSIIFGINTKTINAFVTEEQFLTEAGTGGKGKIQTLSENFHGEEQQTYIDNFSKKFKTSLEIVFIPSSVQIIGEKAFEDCNELQLVKIEENSELLRIKKEAFLGCTKLEKLTLPNSIREIDVNAFQNCRSLLSINIPQQLAHLSNREGKESSIFKNCEKLKSVIFPETLTYAATASGGEDSAYNEYRPEGSDGHSFTIGNNCFENCKSLVTICLPDAVFAFGENAFFGCTSLTSIEYQSFHSSQLTRIGQECFNGSSSLKWFMIPKNIKYNSGNSNKHGIHEKAFFRSGIDEVYVRTDNRLLQYDVNNVDKNEDGGIPLGERSSGKENTKTAVSDAPVFTLGGKIVKVSFIFTIKVKYPDDYLFDRPWAGTLSEVVSHTSGSANILLNEGQAEKYAVGDYICISDEGATDYGESSYQAVRWNNYNTKYFYDFKDETVDQSGFFKIQSINDNTITLNNVVSWTINSTNVISSPKSEFTIYPTWGEHYQDNTSWNYSKTDGNLHEDRSALADYRNSQYYYRGLLDVGQEGSYDYYYNDAVNSLTPIYIETLDAKNNIIITDDPLYYFGQYDYDWDLMGRNFYDNTQMDRAVYAAEEIKFGPHLKSVRSLYSDEFTEAGNSYDTSKHEGNIIGLKKLDIGKGVRELGGRIAGSYAAKQDFEIGGYSDVEDEYNHEGIIITELDKTFTELVIPDQVKIINNYAFVMSNDHDWGSSGYWDHSDGGVGPFEDYAARNERGFFSIHIGDGVTYIGNYAFAFQYRLNRLKLGENVHTIGKGAFLNFTTISASAAITEIDTSTFSNGYEKTFQRSLPTHPLHDGASSLYGKKINCKLEPEFIILSLPDIITFTDFSSSEPSITIDNGGNNSNLFNDDEFTDEIKEKLQDKIIRLGDGENEYKVTGFDSNKITLELTKDLSKETSDSFKYIYIKANSKILNVISCDPGVTVNKNAYLVGGYPYIKDGTQIIGYGSGSGYEGRYILSLSDNENNEWDKGDDTLELIILDEFPDLLGYYMKTGKTDYENNENFTETLFIPNSVKNIGEYAFSRGNLGFSDTDSVKEFSHYINPNSSVFKATFGDDSEGYSKTNGFPFSLEFQDSINKMILQPYAISSNKEPPKYPQNYGGPGSYDIYLNFCINPLVISSKFNYDENQRDKIIFTGVDQDNRLRFDTGYDEGMEYRLLNPSGMEIYISEYSLLKDSTGESYSNEMIEVELPSNPQVTGSRGRTDDNWSYNIGNLYINSNLQLGVPQQPLIINGNQSSNPRTNTIQSHNYDSMYCLFDQIEITKGSKLIKTFPHVTPGDNHWRQIKTVSSETSPYYNVWPPPQEEYWEIGNYPTNFPDNYNYPEKFEDYISNMIHFGLVVTGDDGGMNYFNFNDNDKYLSSTTYLKSEVTISENNTVPNIDGGTDPLSTIITGLEDVTLNEGRSYRCFELSEPALNSLVIDRGTNNWGQVTNPIKIGFKNPGFFGIRGSTIQYETDRHYSGFSSYYANAYANSEIAKLRAQVPIDTTQIAIWEDFAQYGTYPFYTNDSQRIEDHTNIGTIGINTWGSSIYSNPGYSHKDKISVSFFEPQSKAALKRALAEWIKSDNRDVSIYNNVHIKDWDVSNITDMSELFKNTTDFDTSTFNDNISSWDVRNVVNMRKIFYGAAAFNCNIDSWDVGSVNDMSYMFYGASSFNTPLSTWNTTKVRDMSYMFYGASSFNGSIKQLTQKIDGRPYKGSFKFAFTSIIEDEFISWTSWDTNNVVKMNHMFYGCLLFNQDISFFNMSSIVNMNSMFENASSFSIPLFAWVNSFNFDNLDDSSFTNMFSEATRFNNKFVITDIDEDSEQTKSNYENFFKQEYFRPTTKAELIDALKNNSVNIKSLDTSLITDMSELFSGDSDFNGDISSWDVSNVTDMSDMFKHCSDFNQDISQWNTEKVMDMSDMFNGCVAFNKSLKLWNTSNVTTMENMFYGATKFNNGIEEGEDENNSLNYWNVGNVLTMENMFNGATSFNSDIKAWNVKNVANVRSMFQGATSFNQDIFGWTLYNVKGMIADKIENNDSINMFYGASAMKEPYKINIDENSLIQFKIVGNNVAPNENIIIVRNTRSDSFQQIRQNIDFDQDDDDDTKIHVFNNKNFKTDADKELQIEKIFSSFIFLNGNNKLEKEQTTLTITFSLFHKTIFKPESNDDLKDAISAWLNRYNASSEDFNNVDISYWDTSEIEDMSELFKNKATFNDDISQWNVSKVTNMTNMFEGAEKFSYSLKRWTVQENATLTNMFDGATKYIELYGGNNDTDAKPTPNQSHFIGRFTPMTYEELKSAVDEIWPTFDEDEQIDQVVSLNITNERKTENGQLIISEYNSIPPCRVDNLVGYRDDNINEESLRWNAYSGSVGSGGLRPIIANKAGDYRSYGALLTDGSLKDIFDDDGPHDVTSSDDAYLSKLEYEPEHTDVIENHKIKINGEENPNLELMIGNTYRFDLKDISNSVKGKGYYINNSIIGLAESPSITEQAIYLYTKDGETIDNSARYVSPDFISFKINKSFSISFFKNIKEVNLKSCQSHLGERAREAVGNIYTPKRKIINFTDELTDGVNVTDDYVDIMITPLTPKVFYYNQYDKNDPFNYEAYPYSAKETGYPGRYGKINVVNKNGKYGIIGDWDVSNITTMDRLFENKATFNSDISSWDTSSVKTMESMFDGASSFNQPL